MEFPVSHQSDWATSTAFPPRVGEQTQQSEGGEKGGGGFGNGRKADHGTPPFKWAARMNESRSSEAATPSRVDDVFVACEGKVVDGFGSESSGALREDG